MACDHNENDDIQTELAKLNAPVQRHPSPRLAGTTIQLYVDATETNERLKTDALASALALVHARTGQRFEGLKVYLGEKCRCIAYAGEAGGNRQPVLFLGDQMLSKTPTTSTEAASGVKGGHSLKGERGVADQRYDDKRKHVLNPSRVFMGKDAYQAVKLNAKAIAIIVHEFGHVLHERLNSGVFWGLKTTWATEENPDDRPPSDLAMQVSQYATKSKLEFVAEIFTGRIYGKHYSPQVLAKYQEYGGVAFT
jgi:hypothetical protein